MISILKTLLEMLEDKKNDEAINLLKDLIKHLAK